MLTQTVRDLEQQLDDLQSMLAARACCPPSELPTEVYSLWDGELDDLMADIHDIEDALLAERCGDPDAIDAAWMAKNVEMPETFEPIDPAYLI